MRVEYRTVFFSSIFLFPHWVYSGVSNPCTLVVSFLSSVGIILAVIDFLCVLVFSLLRDDALWKTCYEGAILHNGIEHRCGIETFGGEVSLLCFLEEFLYSEIDDVRDFCEEHLVQPLEFAVDQVVALYVSLTSC